MNKKQTTSNKQNKNLKQTIFSFCAILLGFIASLFALFNIFDFALGPNKIAVEDYFGFFSEGETLDLQRVTYALFKEEYNPAFKTIAGVFAVIVLLTTIIYFATLLLKTKNNNIIKTLKLSLSIIMIVCGVIIAISLIIFVSINSIPKQIAISCNVFGAIAVTIFPVIAGICGLLAERK